MRTKLEKFTLILGGAIVGILLSINLPVFADKTKSSTLPIDDLRTFAEVFGKIKSDYVEPIADKKLINEALNGMLSGLDPHSTFLDLDHFKDLQQGTTGDFGGLGIEVGMEDGYVLVVSPIEDTPAYKAGLKSGDLIMKLDTTAVKGLTLTEAIKLMRGKPGTSIVLKVLRKGVDIPFDIKVTRAQIKTKSVKAKLVEPNYAYIRVTQFQERTGEDLAIALKKLRVENKFAFNGIILDMRNNPGGLLNSSVAVSAAFLKEGDLVVYTEGRAPDSKMNLTTSPENFVRNDPKKNNFLKDLPSDIKDTPMVVLINNGSASASEIVAGALQDHKRALIVGTRSFGKGSVQSILPMANGTAIKLTTARYFTPNGRSIQGKGIEPDVIVDDGMDEFAIREADLNNTLSNPEEGKKEDLKKNMNGDTKLEEIKEGPTDDGAAALRNFKPIKFGEKDDKQFNEALNILKGIDLYQKN
ncbi:S41 family peptidase [Methylophilaceae bacterium]|jgi:carboxyl-terminal processing protease|nr:S41 family peptidase [Methylophilaceae bacterium]|tara:strand:- start:3415 stop:4824 length:1410 start_codon:yes stop_codon:yes gene_type:complete